MKEYQMTDEQLKKLIDACKSTPCIKIGNYIPPSPQENANRAWDELGRELGFKGDTVKPIHGKDQRFFTAEPIEEKKEDEKDSGD